MSLISRPKESLRDCRSLLQALKAEYDGYAEALTATLPNQSVLPK